LGKPYAILSTLLFSTPLLFALLGAPAAFAHEGEPTAALTASPVSGPVPLEVAFDGSGSFADPVTSLSAFTWQFGDGAPPAFDSTTGHVYTVPGGYRATLTVVDALGVSGQAAQPIEVLSADGQRPPSAAILASALSGQGPLTVDFSCDCEDGDAALQGATWDVDGETQTGWDLQSTFAPGVHTVRLTAVDANGLSARDSVQVAVTDAAGNLPPTCRIYASPPSGVAPLGVTYVGEVHAGSGTITTQKLVASDGTVSTTGTLSTVLGAPGWYGATWKVTDSNGLSCSDAVQTTALSDGHGVPPRIVSVAPPPGEACGSWSYQAVAQGDPPFEWALAPVAGSSAVPAGLQVDPETGWVVLDASVAKGARATLRVTNAAGTATQALALDLSGCKLSANVGGCDAGGAGGGLLATAVLLGLLAFDRRLRGQRRR
jgi:PKD repeat protein